MHRQVESKAEAGLAFLEGNRNMSNYNDANHLKRKS